MEPLMSEQDLSAVREFVPMWAVLSVAGVITGTGARLGFEAASKTVDW